LAFYKSGFFAIEPQGPFMPNYRIS